MNTVLQYISNDSISSALSVELIKLKESGEIDTITKEDEIDNNDPKYNLLFPSAPSIPIYSPPPQSNKNKNKINKPVNISSIVPESIKRAAMINNNNEANIPLNNVYFI